MHFCYSSFALTEIHGFEEPHQRRHVAVCNLCLEFRCSCILAISCEVLCTFVCVIERGRLTLSVVFSNVDNL